MNEGNKINHRPLKVNTAETDSREAKIDVHRKRETRERKPELIHFRSKREYHFIGENKHAERFLMT